VRANFRETYRAHGCRHVDRCYLDAGRLLTVGMVVKIGSHRCAEKHPTVLSAQLTRDRMMARYMNAMSDTPAGYRAAATQTAPSESSQRPSGLIPSKFAKTVRCSNVPSLSILNARSRFPSVSATSRSCALVIANPFGCAMLSATVRILPSGVVRRTRADAKQSGPEAFASKDVTYAFPSRATT
jgi:hypothetical protein